MLRRFDDLVEVEAEFANHFEVVPETSGDDIQSTANVSLRPSTFARNLSPSTVWSILQTLKGAWSSSDSASMASFAASPRATRADSSSLIPLPIS